MREAHLPIYPSEAHPDSDRLLRLEGGTRLRRNSYVKIERVYEVDLELLGSYDDCGGVYRLAAESWEELVDCLNMGDCEGWDGDKEGSDKVHFDFMRLLELLGTVRSDLRHDPGSYATIGHMITQPWRRLLYYLLSFDYS